MKKNITGFWLFTLLITPMFAQEATLIRQLDSIVISAASVAKDAPVSHSQVGRAQLQQVAPSQNLPFALSLTPGAVAVGENGTGSGYSYLRIRGSEGSRIQVNLNGIAINDAESQEVFWVNLPALSAFLEKVQVQRGLGSSVNGTGAFGATVSMQTLYSIPDPYAMAEVSYGSFHTWNTVLGAGTGVGSGKPFGQAAAQQVSYMPKGLSFDVMTAHGLTEGYIRNGDGRTHSLFSRLSYVRPAYSLRAFYLYGSQHTGITWEGISRQQLETDRRSNPAGAFYNDAGTLCYYDNETDNYVQHHVQLNYLQLFGDSFTWNNTVHMTKGDGYYENYIENGKQDYVVRRSLDNTFLAYSSVLRYGGSGYATRQAGGAAGRLSASLGVNYSYYWGNHFGLDASPQNGFDNSPHEYYRNTGDKSDFSLYLKTDYTVETGTAGRMQLYADLQVRRVAIDMMGADNDQVALDYATVYRFFNPKVGITVTAGPNSRFYATVGMGHREPTRSDIKESIKAQSITLLQPERMLDYEAGYRLTRSRFALGVNLYAMEYKNQLVPTGKRSDTGYEIKENVPESFRRGVETEVGWRPLSWLKLEGNFCLSTNRIKALTLYLDTYDHPDSWNPVSPQITEYYERTPIIYSPGYTATTQAEIRPFSRGIISAFSALLTAKYVGKQYYDNTGSQERALPAYQVLSLTFSQPFTTRRCGTFTLGVFLDNILNKRYCANAWAYRAAFTQTGTYELSEGFYPQAGFNAMVKVAWRIK